MMSRAQLEVMGAIRRYRSLHGFGPSIRDICELTGTSASTVHKHLENLRSIGMVTWERGRTRTLTAVDIERKVCPTCAGEGTVLL